jgi:hypothetical protein
LAGCDSGLSGRPKTSTAEAPSGATTKGTPAASPSSQIATKAIVAPKPALTQRAAGPAG